MDISLDEQYLWYYDEQGNYIQVRDPRDEERYREWMLWHGSSEGYGRKWYNKKWKSRNQQAVLGFKLEGLVNILLVVGGVIILEKGWS